MNYDNVINTKNKYRNTEMPKKGLRPHTWKVQGAVAHEQYVSWLKSKAQAQFRGELWLLTFEQYQQAWMGQWDQRGRCRGDLCLTREDITGAWEYSNVTVMSRIEHLRRQKLFRKHKHDISL